MKTATYSRKNAEAERLKFIQDWCKERGVDPQLTDNFDRAAFEWAKTNSTFEELTRPKVLPNTLENRKSAFRSAMKATFAFGFNNGTY